MKAFIVVAFALALVGSFAIMNADSNDEAYADPVNAVIIDEDKTYTDGEKIEIKDDVIVKSNVVLTFEEGSILSISAADSFSYQFEGSKIVMEEGSIIELGYIAGTETIVLDADYEMEIKGKITYAAVVDILSTPMKITGVLTIDEGTVVGDEMSQITFKKTEFSFGVNLKTDIPEILKPTDIFDKEISFDGIVKFNTDGVTAKMNGLELASLGKTEMNLQIFGTTPPVTKDGKLTIKVAGYVSSSLTAQGITMAIDSDVDLSAGIEGVQDIDWSDWNDLLKVIPFMDGSFETNVTVNADTETIKIKDAKVKMTGSVSNEVIKCSEDFSVDSIAVDYDGVKVTLGKSSSETDVEIGLGTFMELYSARNIAAIITFTMMYIPDEGEESLKEFVKDVVAPVYKGEDLDFVIDMIISSIPEESMPFVAAPAAYILYTSEISEKDFGTECQKIADAIGDKGYATTLVEYSEGVSDLIFTVVTGIEDPEPMTLTFSSETNIGKITVAMEGFDLTFDGTKDKFGYKDGNFTAEGEFGAIAFNGETPEYGYSISTPSMSGELTLNEQIMDFSFEISGDIKTTFYSKANDEAINARVDYNGIDYEFKFYDEADKGAKLSEELTIKSSEIEYNGIVLSIGKIHEKGSITEEYGNLSDIFSMRNLDLIAGFFMDSYDPSKDMGAIESVLYDIIYTAYPDDETKQMIDEAIAQIPDEAVPYAGMVCQYVIYVYSEEGLSLPRECSKIKEAIGDVTTPEGAIQYFIEVDKNLFIVISGINEPKLSTIEIEIEASVGEVKIDDKDKHFDFDGASYDMKISDSGAEVSYEFKGLEASMAHYGYKVELKLPEVSVDAKIGEEVKASGEVKGEFLFDYDDDGLEERVYHIHAQSIDSSFEIEFNEDGELTINTDDKIDDFDMYVELEMYDVQASAVIEEIEFSATSTEDVVGIIKAIITGDYETIDCYVDASGKVSGLFYAHSMSGERFSTMKFAIDNVTYDLAVNVKGLDITGSYDASISSAYMSDSLYNYTIENWSLGVDLKDMVATIDAKGDASYTLFSGGQATLAFGVDDAVAKATVNIENIQQPVVEITELSAGLSVWQDGITADFGKVTVEGDIMSKDFTVKSDKITFSGNYTGKDLLHSELKSVEGTITNVVISPNELTLISILFDDAEISIVETNGGKATLTATIDDTQRQIKYAVETSGEGYVIGTDVFNEKFLYYAILSSPSYMTYDRVLEISGNVPFGIVGNLNLNDMNVTGKYSLSAGTYINGDVTIDVVFSGAYLVIECGKTGGNDLSIVAAPGYDLDPTTYVGFTVDANNYVTPTYDEGYAELATISKGKEFTLTIDGVAQKVKYGDIAEKTWLGNEPLWVVDKDGNVYGTISDGKLSLYYIYLYDLSLTSVYGKEAVPTTPGKTIEVDDNAFYVTIPEDGEVIVKNKAGVGFFITGYEGQVAKFSAEETKYDRYRAYNIEGNGPATIYIPIETIDANVYHVINDTPVLMATEIYYDAETDQTYAAVDSTSYSVYFVDELSHENGGGKDNTLLYTAIIVIIIVLVVAGFFVAKKKGKI